MNDVLAGNIVWNLDDLYEGPDDARIKEDLDRGRDEAQRFAASFRGIDL